MTRRTRVLDQLEPEAIVAIHPKTMRRMNIAAGDLIRLTTRRGSVQAAARADRAVSEDTVFMPFAFVEAAANTLTNPSLDPVGKIPEFKYAAVRLERSDTPHLKSKNETIQ